MSTTHIAAALFQLQQLDLEIDRLVVEQQALASSLQSTSSLKRLRTEQTVAQQQLASGMQAQKDAEWALQEIEQRLKRQEQRLYNGSVVGAKAGNSAATGAAGAPGRGRSGDDGSYGIAACNG